MGNAASDRLAARSTIMFEGVPPQKCRGGITAIPDSAKTAKSGSPGSGDPVVHATRQAKNVGRFRRSTGSRSTGSWSIRSWSTRSWSARDRRIGRRTTGDWPTRCWQNFATIIGDRRTERWSSAREAARSDRAAQSPTCREPGRSLGRASAFLDGPDEDHSRPPVFIMNTCEHIWVITCRESVSPLHFPL